MTDLDVSRYNRILFFTGAGLSVESGVPTYRGRGGVWKKYDYTTIACQEAFDRDPETVWNFNDSRREQMAAVDPNLGHKIIATVQRTRPGTKIVTQNIDGLHQRAGAEDVIELHGSVWRVRCEREHKVWEELQCPVPSRKCTCGEWLRPDIVWFGDQLNPDVLGAAGAALATCDLLVSIGTSAVVYPAADLPHLARRAGATCVEINPEPTPMSDLYDVTMRAPASEALGALWPEMV
jgi:NAD-dependent deacetylase